MNTPIRCAAWMLGATLAAAAGADEGVPALGRLFFSPAERATLDAAREAAAIPPPVVSDEEVPHLPEVDLAETVHTPPPPPLTLNGFVARSAGPATLWVNGTVQDARHLAVPGARVRLGRDALEVAFDDASPAQRVKPGQTLDPAAPAIREAHERTSPDPDDVAAP